MKRYATGLAAMLAMALATTPALAKGVFDGTWKGDVKASKPAEKPSIILLQAGTFSCTTCKPALKFPADGAFHVAAGMARDAGAEVATATTVEAALACLREQGAALVMIDIATDVCGFLADLAADQLAQILRRPCRIEHVEALGGQIADAQDEPISEHAAGPEQVISKAGRIGILLSNLPTGLIHQKAIKDVWGLADRRGNSL